MKTRELAVVPNTQTAAVHRVSQVVVQQVTRCALGTTTVAQTVTIYVMTVVAHMVLQTMSKGSR